MVKTKIPTEILFSCNEDEGAVTGLVLAVSRGGCAVRLKTDFLDATFDCVFFFPSILFSLMNAPVFAPTARRGKRRSKEVPEFGTSVFLPGRLEWMKGVVFDLLRPSPPPVPDPLKSGGVLGTVGAST